MASKDAKEKFISITISATCLFVVAALNHHVQNIVIKKVDECVYMRMYVISPF